jgi:NADPH:quinone reductase-like Zn-dependent oxidoreductase
MKAMIWTKYGPPDVLQLREVDKPIPRDNEVLVKVHAASAFSGDCELRRFHIIPSGWLFLRLYIGVIKPKRITILGQEMAGVIETIGKDVTRFREGDQVFGTPGIRMGTYAEYVCISEDSAMVIKPDSIMFEEAAVISAGGFEALHFYQKAKIRKGQKILINGAGGSIGTMALQLAKMSDAEVTCVDSALKLDMLKTLGADKVIDYTKDDFTKNVETYDVVFDLVGNISFSRTMRSLKKNGVLVLGNSGLITSRLFSLRAAISSKKRVISNLRPGTKDDLEYLKDVIASRKIKVVIDKRFPLERTADAHRYIEQGLKKGNVVITVIDDRPDPGNE